MDRLADGTHAVCAAEVAEAKARLDALATSEGTDPGSIAIIESFSNQVPTRLRDQYLDDGAGTTLRKLRTPPINPQTSSASPLGFTSGDAAIRLSRRAVRRSRPKSLAGPSIRL